MIVDSATGAIAESFNYDEFGVSLEGKTSNIIPFGFAGGLYDSDTGLVRFGARDYSPVVGRWTNKDPSGFNGGMANLYGYAYNDPVNFADMNGRNPFMALGALVGAAMNGYAAIQANATPQQFVASVVTGAAMGALAGSGAGIIEAAVYGFAVGFGNNGINQMIFTGDVKLGSAIQAGVATALTGAAGAVSVVGINTLLTAGVSETMGFAIGTGLGMGINSGIPNSPAGNAVGCPGH